jgi:hypothetical protein
MTIPKIPSMPGVESGGSDLLHQLPIKIPTEVRTDGRLFIRSSKMVFFNRIAKTGSQAFIALLYKLESVNGFKVC